MIGFVVGGMLLMLGLRALMVGSKWAWEDGKVSEILLALVILGFFGAVGMCVMIGEENVSLEFLWQWLSLMGVGVLVALVCVMEELRSEMDGKSGERIVLAGEWVLRAGMWCAGWSWLWWMMG